MQRFSIKWKEIPKQTQPKRSLHRKRYNHTMGCFRWQKDKCILKWPDELKEKRSPCFQAQMWWQDLAQEVLQSPTDERQQGVLREIKLEKEQIDTHQYIIHFCPMSEAAPRFFIHFHILADTEREQSSVSLLVLGDSYRNSILAWGFAWLILVLFILAVPGELTHER